MALDAAAAITQIDPLLAAVQQGTYTPPEAYIGSYYKGSDTEKRALLTRMITTIERWARPGSTYRVQTAATLADTPHDSSRLLVLAGVLQALRDDIEAGYLGTVEAEIHADVFSDFLTMAEEWHGAKSKDAAAVIAGSVLEEHLRKLAAANGLSVESGDGRPVSADRINSDLVKANAYNKIEQAQVTAWLAVRNRAAHGKYAEYDAGQVASLIRDVRGFVIRHPA